MKLGFVVASVSRRAGGLHESVRRLAQSLSSSTQSIEVFSLKDDDTAIDQGRWAPLPVCVSTARGPQAFGFAPGLRAALTRSDCALVMSHGLWMYPSIATYGWHRDTGRPYIVHPHGMLDPWAIRNSRFKKGLAALLYENRHLQRAACIRALCESEAQAIRAYGLQNPICIIPNGIDVPIEEQGLATGLEQEFSVVRRLSLSGRKVLLFLGRLHPKKGLIRLLRAWALVQNSKSSIRKSEFCRWVLAIAGWDQNDHEAQLKTLADELGLRWTDSRGSEFHEGTQSSTQVVFLGPQFGHNKNECYRNCDAFILPSFSEGLPMVVLEAWAYGKPVLMTLECNLPEGFTANAALRIGTGPMTKTETTDPLGVASALRDLFGFSKDDCNAMGHRGRKLVTERFSWGQIAEQMKTVYTWILAGAPKPGCLWTQ